MVALLLLSTSLGLLGKPARAQVTGQGTISGTVVDSTGAVIVGAQITITNIGTNVSNKTVTNSTGYFEVNNLNPGVRAYKIVVTASGFEKLAREGITLETGSKVNVPLPLNPGASS